MSHLRDKILAAEDRPFRDVPTPEWAAAGVPAVRIISMSAADRDLWEGEALIDRMKVEGTARFRNLRAALVGRCAVDPATGARIFGEADIEALGQKSAKALDRLFGVASDLNAVSETDMKALEKNSARDPFGALRSALRWLRVASMWKGFSGNSAAGKSPNGRPSSESRAIH